jgi:hypothetical protein
LPQYQDLGLFPVVTTRFHPTFAYEMLWNFAAAGFLLWLARRYREDLKPGTIFAGWLVLAGVGRVIIEFFRPDQPKIPDLGISYSSIFAALMAIAGAILLLVRYQLLNLRFTEDWEENYRIGGDSGTVAGSEAPADGQNDPRLRKLSPAAAKRVAKKTSPGKSTKAPASQTKKP